jgi:uncharacterized membrane protein YeaQ/YmgE (transglycosylase-associated protein family)
LLACPHESLTQTTGQRTRLGKRCRTGWHPSCRPSHRRARLCVGVVMIFALITMLMAGCAAGFVFSKLVDLRGDDPTIGIIVAGLVGAVGGGLFAVLSGRGLVLWDMIALLVAAAVGGAGAFGYHTIRSRFVSKVQQSVRRSY